MKGNAASFDVAVVGAGPAGCVAALAYARSGARVALIEANPRAMERLAGEWLHPRGLRVLRELGVDPSEYSAYDTGHGFVVHPEDGSPAIVLPYADGARGYSCEHPVLVSSLRHAAEADPNVVYLAGARVVSASGGSVVVQRGRGGGELHLVVGRVVGADGRSSRMRRELGLADERVTLSRMAGLRLEDAPLPIEGYGQVLLGGPGPVLAYRIGERVLRVCLDVPLETKRDPASLWEAYSPVFPEAMRPALAQALQRGGIAWALNQKRPRASHGHGDGEIVLVGDAVGFQHPLTALGMTLGFGDGVALADSPNVVTFARRRARSTRVAELVAELLYEVFSSDRDSDVAMRQAVYALWRSDPAERSRTMRYLAGEDGQRLAFVRTFTRVAGSALATALVRATRGADPRGALGAARALAGRAAWLASRIVLGPGRARGVASRAETAETAEPAGEATPDSVPDLIASDAIASAVEALVSEQREDGSFEGEVVWCPMLAAQYVLFCEALGIGMSKGRRAGILRHFERTRLEGGLWGLHECSEPYLFVTTLVYVAARLLGVRSDSALLAPALAFIREQRVLAIPSWGKFWLALLGLYDWRGVPPTLPELWALPERLPLHPSRFYCHTRQIYLAMSSLYGRRVRARESARLDEIRGELYPDGMVCIDWDAARGSLRAEELNTPPGLALRLIYRLGVAYDRRHHAGLRRRVLEELDERIRFELRSTDHTSLSPVSGLLNILALHASHPDDPDVGRALERLEAWFWHDERGGTRIAGARSASWDTSFALQALVAAGDSAPADAAAEKVMERAASFLRGQQIRQPLPGHRQAFRLDPRGGFCFASVWHGWPVSDCTAEALDALVVATPSTLEPEAEREAVHFILRCQNPDGGFGSYEARRTRIGLEWLNPAEMFGESMTEHSYVECTASSLGALSGFRRRLSQGASGRLAVEHRADPLDALPNEVDRAIERAERRLRRLQHADGSWRGVWGVHFLYGTLFGVRGLVAAGAPPSDPALRRACAWVRARQHADGGWGEHHRGCLEGSYVDHQESQGVQTAWALLTLLEARDPDWSAIVRGAAWLVEQQGDFGRWPREEPVGLFFRTALLDYELYRATFPLWALAVYEQRRLERAASAPARDAASAPTCGEQCTAA